MKPRVLLDSGAFTAQKKKKTIDIDKYAKYVIKHGDEYAGCFNLDAIGQGKDEQIAKSKQDARPDELIITTAEQSYLNWEYLRKKGANTIPVYHIGTDEKWLRKYLDQTDYIGLGAIANLDTNQRLVGLDVLWKKYFLDKKGVPKVKVHGLGLTAIPIMLRYPWYSVDSFTPVISAVWGSVLLPRYKDKFQYLDLNIYRISDQADHGQGITGSFATLPRILQKRYIRLFERNGFELGEIAYQKQNPRRGKREKPKQEPMFDIIKPPSKNKTLANHWEERMRWNLTLWNKLRTHMTNDVIMYMGVSTTTHLKIYNMVKPKLDILISYAYLSESIDQMRREYVK